MKNSIAVLIYSLGHKSKIVSRLTWVVHFNLIANLPFEHYCVFCRTITNDWWCTREDYEKDGWFEMLESSRRFPK